MRMSHGTRAVVALTMGVLVAGCAGMMAGARSPGHTDADVRFMQDMIVHHAQAIEMVALVEARTERPDIRLLAERIQASQADEMAMMAQWLEDRGRSVPAAAAAADGHHRGDHHPAHDHTGHDHGGMAGMLTAAQMAALAAARGSEFDRLFLEGMIHHHEGALTMVEQLLATDGAAQEPEIFNFASHVESDQRIEIQRMHAMLRTQAEATAAARVGWTFDPLDPRIGLAPGLHDAEAAARGMELLVNVPLPEGFYNPADPSDFGFANTDLAFRGDLVIVGNYHGFTVYDVSDPARPRLRTSVVCPGGQGDVSVYGDLVFMSVEETRGRIDCGVQGVAQAVSPERFRGVRIFDISNLDRPVQVAAVQTCRGSHTHTLVDSPTDRDHVYVYVSGAASVRAEAELEGCIMPASLDDEAVDRSALFRIEVIRVPLDRPQDARVVSEPRVFADAETGDVAGLWRGGDHGPGTQRTAQTNHCHDITAYPALGIAAGACSGNGILLDIRDPVNPVRIDEVADPNFAYWHSATFNNDGTTVIFTDEWGGGTRARCRAEDRAEWGANAIFEIVDGRLEHRGYYKLPVPQTELENCVAHNGSLVPVPGRDIKVQAWYQGGISVFDFTDPADPFEIAFFDRGPISAERLVASGFWSAYWYNGHVYGSEINRGLDVLRLVPTELLSQNEIDAANLVRFDEFNPQRQPVKEWPASPVVARAYLDQLVRAEAVSAERAARLANELDALDRAAQGRARDAAAQALRATAGQLEREASVARADGRTIDADRLTALGRVLRNI